MSLAQLARAAAALAATDERRAQQVARRDALIADALAAGASWRAVMRATGLNPSAVAKSLRRHAAICPEHRETPHPG